MPTLSQQDQVLLSKLLTALACLSVRSSPALRGQVIEILVRDHEPEIVAAVIKRAA